MDIRNHNQALSDVIKQRNIAAIGLVISGIIILLLAISLFFKERIVIVTPSVIAKEYSISSSRVSKSYLEDMSRDIITTLFNLTPKNVSYMADTLLLMVHPSAYGEVKEELVKIQDDVITRKVSTIFYPISMAVDEENLLVRINGDFHTFIGNAMTAKERKSFEIKFIYTGAKLTIGGFHEILKDN